MRGVVVLGAGVTGRAVARFLRERGDVVTVVDDAAATEERRAWAAGLGVSLVSGPDEASLGRIVSGSRLIVPSPGVPVGHAVFRLAAAAGVPVRSEIELGWECLVARGEGGRPVLVAVTGTNGKTTVTTLAASMLVSSGLTAVAAGNIGSPLIEAAGLEVDVIVAEVSSFQLHFTDRFRPAVGCWLNLAEDHLDWHPDMDHYTRSKARIWAAQGPGDVAVVNADDPAVLAAAAAAGAMAPGVRHVRFSSAGTADFMVAQGRLVGPAGLELVAVAELPRALPLDVSNALAASATALAAGASVEGCRTALRQFPGLPHRIELVGECGGVRWYDDSKATTPASVLAALAGIGPSVLIAGGRNKGLDLSILGSATGVRAVVAIGEAAGEIAAAFAGRSPAAPVVPVVTAVSMAAAVSAAARLARPGDAVLLSPGCASFDWYRSYAERGDDYASLVRALIGTERVERTGWEMRGAAHE